jgi:hypothetical protein
MAARALAATVCTGLLAGHRPAHADGISAPTPMADAADDAKPDEGVSFVGQVVEFETGKSVAKASILVERFQRSADPQPIPPPWVGKSTIQTDADGRFRLTFPPEQVADRRLAFTLRVTHPGFITRKSWETELVALLRDQARGDKPFFETVTIEKGTEYTGQVATPVGKPALELPFMFVSWTGTANRSPRFQDDYHGLTDTDGRFRIRMPKSHSVALYVLPPQPPRARFPYAPYQHFYGTAQPGKEPDVWAPTDFGRVVLKRGVRLSGRLLDLEGRPIAGQTITAFPKDGAQDRHSATTEADGSFVLGPLRHANYRIYGEGQDGFGGVDPFAPPLRPSARVFKPVKVYLKEDVVPEPLVLREASTVRVELQFVDSRGKPAVGGAAKIWGLIPNAHGIANAGGVGYSRLASAINDPESEDTSDRIDWSMQERPDADGRIVFRVPEGLQESSLSAYAPDETIAYKTRLEEHGPLKFWGGGELGTLDADRRITIISYRAPTVLVSVRTDDDRIPQTELNVGATFEFNLASFGSRFVRQADGRYRGGVMPDQEFKVIAASRDYVPKTVPRLNLPEGGSAELTVVLRKRPKPPETGKPARPFLVRTIDGALLSRDSLRGRFVLLHFWAPNRANHGLIDLPHLKVVADQFGKDDRFTMISLCLVNDAEVATRIIKDNGLTWKHVVLRDHSLDPMAMDYLSTPAPKSFLIGPDGTLIAKDMNGIQIEKSVNDALGRRRE